MNNMQLSINITEQLVNYIFTKMLYGVGTITENEMEQFIKEEKHILSKDELASINVELQTTSEDGALPVFEVVEQAIERALPNGITNYPKPTILTSIK